VGVASLSVKLRNSVVGTVGPVNEAVTVNADECGVVTCVIDSVAAPSGIVLTFEGQYSDSGPWVVMSARATNAVNHATLLAATAALAALPTFGWAIPALGAKRVRARVSARTSGTVTVRLIPSFQPL